MLKKLFIITFALLINMQFSCAAKEEKILIAINQFVNHPALDSAEAGIEQALIDRKLLPDRVEIKLSNAQGNISTSLQIAKHEAALSPAFMVAIATPAAQSALKALPENTTLAFLAVTDAKAAGLLSAKKIIGVSDQPPIEELLNITLKVLPKLKAIGVIYNPGEINSVKMTEKLEILAAKLDIKIEKSPVTSSSHAKQAAQKLIDLVQIVYLPQDNMVVSSLDTIIQVTDKAGLPVISNDPSLIDKGLLLAYGCDYFKSGMQLGNMIADLIEGKEVKPNIQSSNIKELKVNDMVAKKLAIDIPKDLL